MVQYSVRWVVRNPGVPRVPPLLTNCCPRNVCTSGHAEPCLPYLRTFTALNSLERGPHLTCFRLLFSFILRMQAHASVILRVFRTDALRISRRAPPRLLTQPTIFTTHSCVAHCICASSPRLFSGTPTPNMATAAAAGSGDAAASNPLYDITVRDIMGKEHPLGEYIDGKVAVIVNGTSTP